MKRRGDHGRQYVRLLMLARDRFDLNWCRYVRDTYRPFGESLRRTAYELSWSYVAPDDDGAEQ
jgi:hypothetical protein